MSNITDMVIYASGSDIETIAEVNEWCFENDTERHQIFNPLNVRDAGGTKFFVAVVHAMAGNYFPYEKLAEVFPNFDWVYPEDAVLVINPEDSDLYVVKGTGNV